MARLTKARGDRRRSPPCGRRRPNRRPRSGNSTIRRCNSTLFGVDWSNLWLQAQYDDSSVVLTPEIRLTDYRESLNNLTSPDELARKIRVMERATWEAIARIRMRIDVDRALDACAARCGAAGGTSSLVPVVRVPSANSCTGTELKADGRDPPHPVAGTATCPSGFGDCAQGLKQRARASPARRRASLVD